MIHTCIVLYRAQRKISFAELIAVHMYSQGSVCTCKPHVLLDSAHVVQQYMCIVATY